MTKYLSLGVQDCLLVTLIEKVKMKTMIKIVALALTLAVATSVDAQVVKPDKGPKGKDKVTHRDVNKPSKEDVKKRWEAAKKKRDSRRGDAKKRGSKVSDRKGRSFGRLVHSDKKLAALVKEWRGKETDLKKKSRALWEKWKKSDNDAARAKLRAFLGEMRKSHGDASKKHREEVSARLKELRKGGWFKNNRDKQLDSERKHGWKKRGKGDKPGE